MRQLLSQLCTIYLTNTERLLLLDLYALSLKNKTSYLCTWVLKNNFNSIFDHQQTAAVSVFTELSLKDSHLISTADHRKMAVSLLYLINEIEKQLFHHYIWSKTMQQFHLHAWPLKDICFIYARSFKRQLFHLMHNHWKTVISFLSFYQWNWKKSVLSFFSFTKRYSSWQKPLSKSNSEILANHRHTYHPGQNSTSKKNFFFRSLNFLKFFLFFITSGV